MINYKKYMKIEDPDKAHAKLSASGSDMWLNCPATIPLSEGVPKSPDNEASIRGTHTHTLLEFRLKEGRHAPLSKAFMKFLSYDFEMESNVQLALNFILKKRRDLYKKYGKKPILLAEKKVLLPGVGFGTSDVILCIPGIILIVADYKNGVSIVHPEENSQGLYYAVAAATDIGGEFRDGVHIIIIQPNAASSRGPIRTWQTGMKKLKEANQMFLDGAKLALSKKAIEHINPGKWCYWCPAKSKCPATLEKSAEKIKHRFK